MSIRSQSDQSGLPRTAPLQVVIDFINQLQLGRINNTRDLTLTANSATTTITDHRIGSNSSIDFMPTTAHAAAELPTLYVSMRTKGSATVTHTNNAQTDRTYRVKITG